VLRVSRTERFVTWLIIGPIGHLAAGVLFFVELLVRYWWSRARGRVINAWDRPAESS
jgi:hypothetical protein